ncbi:siderophore-iron reductase FhuF [Rhizobium sp. CG5]|uniref:siderophore-iron reductase FhuF n=1 Tax=Rhizobium sp. CG5 TaxID=2726076 RepID=UPI00203338B9|nr:siderophore-iron reductase FhuF [Rhizobium sp. CG5]MCM2474378.1 siderophore-iron reductase FhuF [Rhizobium sp. CG5]
MEKIAVTGAALPISMESQHPVDLDGLLGDGPFPYCREKLLPRAPAGGLVIACTDLADPAVFEGVIARYMRKFPGSDRRAVVSMWSLFYFSILTIAPSVHLFVHRRAVPLGLEGVSLVCDEDTAEPQAFVYSGDVRQSAEPAVDLHGMMLQHVEPVVAAMAANSGLAPKLLWNNVAAYLSWILKEIAYRHETAPVDGGLALLNEPTWPDGRKNPMHGMMRVARQQCGLEFAQRKVCCLRYNLTGVGGCGEACPLPDGRR